MKSYLVAALTLVIVSAILVGFIVLDTNLFNTSSKSSSGTSSLTSFSGISGGLQMSISLEANKTKYSLGEEVVITFLVMNVGNQTQMFVNQNSNASLNFVVYSRAGTLVYENLFGPVPMLNSSVTLSPNGNYTESFGWAQYSNRESGFPQVPAGNYYIVGVTGANPPYMFQTDRLNITIGN